MGVYRARLGWFETSPAVQRSLQPSPSHTATEKPSHERSRCTTASLSSLMGVVTAVLSGSCRDNASQKTIPSFSQVGTSTPALGKPITERGRGSSDECAKFPSASICFSLQLPRDGVFVQTRLDKTSSTAAHLFLLVSISAGFLQLTMLSSKTVGCHRHRHLFRQHIMWSEPRSASPPPTFHN